MIDALDMAIRNRRPDPGGIVHADHGVQFTSWAFGDQVRKAGLMPSFGRVGDGLDNAMMESFWSSMQIELLNRKKWKTRLEHSTGQIEPSTRSSPSLRLVGHRFERRLRNNRIARKMKKVGKMEMPSDGSESNAATRTPITPASKIAPT